MLTGVSKPLLDLPRLLSSWIISLRAANKSPETIRAYRISVEKYLNDYSELTKSNVINWLATMDGEPTSMRLRLAAIKQFARWLDEEIDFDQADSIRLISPPKLDRKPMKATTEAETGDLLKVCNGKDWRSKRDKAILLILGECGIRRAELLALDVADVDLNTFVLTVRRGKGGKARRVRFSATTATALDRYLRSADVREGALWRGNKGGRLGEHGLRHALAARAAQAGIDSFSPHMMRRAMATRWMARGGSETGLMAVGGWTDRSMIARYVGAAQEELAQQEFDRLNMGIA
jgi:integrase